MAKFGGWENWETWQMAIFLDMSEDLESVIKRRIHEEDIASAEASAGGMVEQTADLIGKYVIDRIPKVPYPWSAFFDNALEQVNWFELATRFLKAVGLLTRSGRKPQVGPKEWSP